LDFINFITGFQHGALKPTIFFIQILRTAPSLPAKSTAHFLSWEMAIIIALMWEYEFAFLVQLQH